jgi:diguanylate cyclase (GGDEF)-like protein
VSLVLARKKRTNLYLSIAGLLVMVAAVSAISARDPSGVTLRIGMVMVSVGAGLCLPWRQLIPAVLLAWLAPNLGRSVIEDTALLNLNLLLEAAGLAGVAFFTLSAQRALQELEEESIYVGAGGGDLAGLNVETGIFNANQLRPALQAELARSRRFRRTFSLVLVDIDEMRQKYDYRSETSWKSSLGATTRVLRETRHNVDRVFHYKDNSFAILLPEASEKDIVGLVKRLRRIARSMKPPEGEPGGPIPVHFGATFFPDCATTVDDLLVRAEVALRIAAGNSTRYQLDSAEASELPPAETLRRKPDGEPAEETETQVPAPPPLTNPVAAAVVGEAYAERTREALAQAESAYGQQPVSEPLPAAEAQDAAVATTVTADDAEAVPASEVQAPSEQREEDGPAAALLAQAEQAESAPAPAGAATAPPSDGATRPDSLEAMLAQMDETLALIRAARDHAA